jgi:hypothetical protein
LEGILF